MTLAQVFREEGKEEGLMRGMERGIEVGVKQEKLEIARNALKEGMEIDLVVKFTKLSKKKIEAIAKEIDNE